MPLHKRRKTWIKIIFREAFLFYNIYIYEKLLQVYISIFVYDGTVGDFCFLLLFVLSVYATISTFY